MFKGIRHLLRRDIIAGVGATTGGSALFFTLSDPVLLDATPSAKPEVVVTIDGVNFDSEMRKLESAVSQLSARIGDASQQLPIPEQHEGFVMADPDDVVLENKYCRVVYKKREICGWTVWVDKRLDWEIVRRELSSDLRHVCRMFPPEAIEAIQSDGRAIWIAKNLSELDDAGNENKQQFACVHYDEDWLLAHGNLPQKKNGCLEIYGWDGYHKNNLYRCDMLLHEFSHIYHYIVGFENKTVLKAFEDAKEAKLYDAVEHCSGEKRRAYAMVNEFEYFASLCVPYFWGRNDYYPFIRPQLEEYDQAGFAMLEEVWGILKKKEMSNSVEKEALSSSIENKALSSSIEEETMVSTTEKEHRMLKETILSSMENETVSGSIEKETLRVNMEKEAIQTCIEKEAVSSNEEKEVFSACEEKETISSNIEKEILLSNIDDKELKTF